MPGRAVCPAPGTGDQWTPWHANRPPGASPRANEAGHRSSSPNMGRLGSRVGWWGLRRKRRDLTTGVVEVAEVVTEVHGHLYLGPPKTTAGRRRVGLPRVVVEALQEHLAGRSVEPNGSCSPSPTAPRSAPRASAPGCGVRRPGPLAWRASHPRPAAYGGRPVDRRRGRSQGGRHPRRAHLGELHPGPLRPPGPGSGPGVAGPSGPLSRGGWRCRVGHDVDQMWTTDTESADGSRTATL
jgi:hypothetical protein